MIRVISYAGHECKEGFPGGISSKVGAKMGGGNKGAGISIGFGGGFMDVSDNQCLLRKNSYYLLSKIH